MAFFCFFLFVLPSVMSVYCSLVVTCWERADLLILSNVTFSCFFCHFPIWCPGSGVVLDCIVSLYLPSPLLFYFFFKLLLISQVQNSSCGDFSTLFIIA